MNSSQSVPILQNGSDTTFWRVYGTFCYMSSERRTLKLDLKQISKDLWEYLPNVSAWQWKLVHQNPSGFFVEVRKSLFLLTVPYTYTFPINFSNLCSWQEFLIKLSNRPSVLYVIKYIQKKIRFTTGKWKEEIFFHIN